MTQKYYIVMMMMMMMMFGKEYHTKCEAPHYAIL
jgi:hypothetical protein